MEKLLLVIKADTNDADYIMSIKEITTDVLEKLKPIFKAIKDKDGDWPHGQSSDSTVRETYEDILTENQIENFNSYCPYSNGVHTIESIRVLTVVDEKTYL